MTVYTELTELQISALLSHYDMGHLQSYHGASDGIENTTYFVNLNSGRKLVLTLFEDIDEHALGFYIDLTDALNDRSLPVPCPLRDCNGSAVHKLAGKPVLLFPRVVGRHLDRPGLEEVSKVANLLGKMHQQCLRLSLQHPNPKSLNWMLQTRDFVKPILASAEIELLDEQIQLRRAHEQLQIPRAVIHGDLFRDNVLFHGDKISGVIDFYNAGTDSLLLDIAIAVLDWCVSDNGHVDEEKSAVFIQSYQTQRSLSSLERANWQSAQQLAATLFWLSRLKTLRQVQQGIQLTVKDPEPCKMLLLYHLNKLN